MKTYLVLIHSCVERVQAVWSVLNRSHFSKKKIVTTRILLASMAFVFLAGAANAGETITYYYTDPNGTVLAKADAAGNTISMSDTLPFGKQVLGTPQPGPGYTGHVTDTDSGFIYMQARYYDPEVGRFVSTDLVMPAPADVFLFNRYAYAENNPVTMWDPTGMVTCHHSGEVSPEVQRMRDTSDGCEGSDDGADTGFASSVLIGRGLAAESLPGAGVGAALLRVSTLLTVLSLSGDTPRNKDEIEVYVTYVRTNAQGLTYSGRTRGMVNRYDIPRGVAMIVNRRAAGQPLLNAEGFGPPVPDTVTENYFANRGREQQLIDFNGGARSMGGTTRNMINGISPSNIARPLYMRASNAEFGPLPDNSPAARQP